MRRPPLLTFLTYNRLGNTAISLPSLLRTKSEFELYIMDNDSKDDTWEFVNDTRDPRIVHRKKFKQNMGVGHALNYALSHRKEDQDFINVEADFRIHNMNFVEDFNEMRKTYPEICAFTGTAFPSQLGLIDQRISEYHEYQGDKKPESLCNICGKTSFNGNHEKRFDNRNGKRLYKDTIMGFFAYFPYELMNILMYYDEVDCHLDIDFQARIECMRKKTGYAMDIRASHTLDGGHCDTCLAYHTYCEQGERKCLKYYSRIISQVTNTIGFHNIHKISKERLAGERSFTCNSMWDEKDHKLTSEEKIGSVKILKLFDQYTKEFIQAVDEGRVVNP